MATFDTTNLCTVELDGKYNVTAKGTYDYVFEVEIPNAVIFYDRVAFSSIDTYTGSSSTYNFDNNDLIGIKIFTTSTASFFETDSDITGKYRTTGLKKLIGTSVSPTTPVSDLQTFTTSEFYNSIVAYELLKNANATNSISSSNSNVNRIENLIKTFVNNNITLINKLNSNSNFTYNQKKDYIKSFFNLVAKLLVTKPVTAGTRYNYIILSPSDQISLFSNLYIQAKVTTIELYKELSTSTVNLGLSVVNQQPGVNLNSLPTPTLNIGLCVKLTGTVPLTEYYDLGKGYDDWTPYSNTFVQLRNITNPNSPTYTVSSVGSGRKIVGVKISCKVRYLKSTHAPTLIATIYSIPIAYVPQISFKIYNDTVFTYNGGAGDTAIISNKASSATLTYTMKGKLFTTNLLPKGGYDLTSIPYRNSSYVNYTTTTVKSAEGSSFELYEENLYNCPDLPSPKSTVTSFFDNNTEIINFLGGASSTSFSKTDLLSSNTASTYYQTGLPEAAQLFGSKVWKPYPVTATSSFRLDINNAALNGSMVYCEISNFRLTVTYA